MAFTTPPEVLNVVVDSVERPQFSPVKVGDRFRATEPRLSLDGKRAFYSAKGIGVNTQSIVMTLELESTEVYFGGIREAFGVEIIIMAK